MTQVSDFIKRASDRLGYKRELFKEKNIPTSPSNVIAIQFYGDLRSLFILSSLILKQYMELNKDKYVILCSWPGFQGLFPYVDEYWTLKDEDTAKILAMDSQNLYNNGNLSAELQKGLLECFNILTAKDLSIFYDHGLTKVYRDTFGEVKRYLPEISSPNRLSEAFKNELKGKSGRKIVVYPTMKLWSWQRGKNFSLNVSHTFWSSLLNHLIESGYSPVVYQNWQTYDMSGEFLEKCAYLVERNVADILVAIRYIGMVLDVHSGISRLAIASRTPFLSVDERMRFIGDKEYEIDDLCCDTLRQYIFSFSTMLMAGGVSDWKDSLFDNITVRLNDFWSSIDCVEGSTDESYETISYDRVRDRKSKRMGLSFISSSK